MAKKIEILENTLLKLLVRRGVDADRKNVILSEGELGYTEDGKRLFVGDGTTVGGHITGNKYKGSSVDHNTITDAVEGDYAHNSTSNILYIKTTSSWLSAGRILTAGDGTITINDADGTIVVGSLSANNIHADALGNSLEIDTNSSKNTEILEGKLVYFDMDNNDVIAKINNIKECKINNNDKKYIFNSVITINSDGTKNTANIIY